MGGKTISHYQVLEKLGEGGMGVVYKAEDTKLNRTVALKFVPPEALNDPDLRKRFCQEARAAAALSHPNVCTVYEIDEECGFLAMEFVEGETVEARVRKRPLPIPEALDLAMQAAQGLQAAHEKGVVHRDIKSANLMVTPQGSVKIMDFGLARLTGQTRLTKAGAAMGTPAYMSPEQAQGKAVDRRTDLWSLGVVLYEMVAGQLPFRGDSEAAVAHLILHEDPEPVTSLRAGLPLELERVIGKTLAKDPAERYQHAEDLLVDLRTLLGKLRQSLERDAKRRLHSAADAWMLPGEALGAPAARSRLPWAVAALCAMLAAIAIWAPWTARRSVRPALEPLIRLDVNLGSEVELGYEAGSPVIVSPDGTRLVYCSQSRLFTRRLDQAKPVELRGTESAHAPFFSPDGQWVAFFTPGELKKISVQGGTPVTICQAPNAFGGSWGDDGEIVAALGGSGPLFHVPSAGGTPVPATTLAPEELAHRWPQVLPGAKGVLFTTFTSMYGVEGANVEMQAPGGRRKTLQRGAIWGRYLPSGHLVYMSNGTLFVVPFDLDKLEVRGTPSPVLGDVAYNTGFGSANIDFSGAASGAGIAVYRSGGGAFGLTTIQWLDSTGQAHPLLAKSGEYLTPRLSPDGNRLALTSAGDIWIYDWRRDTMARLTVNGGSNPVWTSDGRYLVFGMPGGLSWARADGAGGGVPSRKATISNIRFPWLPMASGWRSWNSLSKQASTFGLCNWRATVRGCAPESLSPF